MTPYGNTGSNRKNPITAISYKFMPSKNDVRIQTYVDSVFYQSIESYAQYHQISVSKAVSELLKQGLSGFTVVSSVPDIYQPSNQIGDFNQTPQDLSNYVSKSEFEAFKFLAFKLIGSIESSVSSERQLTNLAKAQAEELFNMARQAASKASLKPQK